MTTERRYTGKDRATLLAEGRSRLDRAFPDFTFDFQNDPQRLLLETLIYGARGLNFYADVQMNELWLGTAELRTSIDRIAAEHGENLRGAAPASGDLRVRPAEPPPAAAVMPQGFAFVGDNGLTYETTHAVTWPAGDDGYRTVTVAEGETRRQTFRSNGERFQRLELTAVGDDELLAWRSVEVRVDGAVWQERDDLLDTDDEVYRAAYTADPPYVEFGDGAVGTVPPEGAEIAVEFRVTRGREGRLEAGQITTADDQLTAGGRPVSLKFDDSTGRTSGGSNLEPKSVARSRIPKAAHSDGAVVTDEDFEALVEGFRDPTYGTVAAARAVQVYGLDNDLVASNLIDSITASFQDARQIFDAAHTDIDDDLSNLETHLSDLGSDLQATLAEIDANNPLDTALQAIRTAKQNARPHTVVAVDKSEEIDTSAQSAQTAAESLESEITNLQGSQGSSNNLNPTKVNELQALIDDIKRQTKTGGTIRTASSQIRSEASNLQSDLSTIEDEVDNAQDSRQVAVSAVNDADADRSRADADRNAAVSRLDQLDTDLVDPWESVILGSNSDLERLKDHLDDVLADVCGPNLVSVPILTYDADGFYVAPSAGLRRVVESYIRERAEPSVVFEVVSGAPQLVEPTIETIIDPEPTASAVRIRNDIEQQYIAEMRDKSFGQNLPLDDLYDRARRPDGSRKVNVTITGLSSTGGAASSIDAEGNLAIAEREVLTRPDLDFLELRPDGTKKVI